MTKTVTHATIEDVRAEFDRGNVSEADLRDPAFHLDGYCDYGTQKVYVNPKPSVVLTLLHELIHRRWPAWSERRVVRESERLLSNMSHAEVRAWYSRYQRVVRRHKRPKRIEDD